MKDERPDKDMQYRVGIPADKIWKKDAEEQPKEVAIETPKEGVLAPAQSKKTGGQWLPGQSGNPGGRKSALRTSFGAIAAKVTPAQLADMYWWGLEKAKEQGSPRIVLQYIEFYTHMTDGTPVQRSITASTKLDSFMDVVRELSDDEFSQVEQKLRDG